MEEKKSVQPILNCIQTALKAPKSQYNKFGKYSYRSCEDILEALKPLLFDLKATLTISDEIVLIGERYYVKATATLTYEDDSVSVSAYAREGEEQAGMAPSQVTGSTSSYARKYALNGLFCIDDNKDADDLNTHGKDEKAPTASPKAKDEGMGNLYPQKAEKPQTEPQPPSRKPMTLEEAYALTNNYGEFAGFPLKVAFESNPKALNEVYRAAKIANDYKTIEAIGLIAKDATEKAKK